MSATGIGVTSIRVSRDGRSRFVPERVSAEMPANVWDIAFVAHIPLAPAWATELASVRVSSARLNRQVVRPVP